MELNTSEWIVSLRMLMMYGNVAIVLGLMLCKKSFFKSTHQGRHWNRLFDKNRNPHWYSQRRSLLLRLTQLVDFCVILISPIEALTTWFKRGSVVNNAPKQRLSKFTSVATEICLLADVIFWIYVAHNYGDFGSVISKMVICVAVAELFFLVSRVSYKGIFKFVYYPDGKIYNAGRSMVLIIINYFQSLAMFSVLYQWDRVIINSSEPSKVAFDYIYFSMVFTTVGYGDAVPVNLYAKLLVCSQLFIGMWFLVVVLANMLGALGKPNEMNN